MLTYTIVPPFLLSSELWLSNEKEERYSNPLCNNITCHFSWSLPYRSFKNWNLSMQEWTRCLIPLHLNAVLSEVKTILKTKQHSKWRHEHPCYKADPNYLLTRREQVTVFRLRTGHNRLNYLTYSKLRIGIGHTEQCPCSTGSQTTEHLLQSCPIYKPLRKGIWPDDTPVACKFYGSLGDLKCTAIFIEETGVSIWQTRRRMQSYQHLLIWTLYPILQENMA